MISGVSSYSGYSSYSSTLASTQRNSTANSAAAGCAAGPAKVQEKLFSILDANGDGSVAKDELNTALTAAKDSDSSLTIDIEELFSQLDANADGSIDKQETAALAPPPPHGGHGGPGGPNPEEQFSQLDSDGNGSVALTELSSALGVSSDSSELTSLFGELDSEADGVLSAQETAALAPPPPPPPAQLQAEDSEQLFSALDSDSNGSISKDELGSLFDALSSSDKNSNQSGDSSTAANSGYADLMASLLKQYSENVSYSSKLGSQISLSA
jgi:Ca2+-binding EF-hand superfamily protein